MRGLVACFIALVGLTALAALAATPAVPAAAATKAACRPPGGKLLAKNETIQVCRARERTGRRDRYYACYRRVERRTRTLLGVERFGVAPRGFLLGERFIAYRNIACYPDGTCSGAVVVRNLHARTASRAPIPPNHGSTLAFVMSERGAVAWMRLNLSERVVELRVLDDQGERTVASGGPEAGIDPGSLAISATRVYWVERGITRSAGVGRGP